VGEGSLWNYVRLLDGVTLASPSKYDKMICLVAAMRAVATITEASCLYLCQTKEFVRLHVRNLSSVFSGLPKETGMFSFNKAPRDQKRKLHYCQFRFGSRSKWRKQQQ